MEIVVRALRTLSKGAEVALNRYNQMTSLQIRIFLDAYETPPTPLPQAPGPTGLRGDRTPWKRFTSRCRALSDPRRCEPPIAGTRGPVRCATLPSLEEAADSHRGRSGLSA